MLQNLRNVAVCRVAWRARELVWNGRGEQRYLGGMREASWTPDNPARKWAWHVDIAPDHPRVEQGVVKRERETLQVEVLFVATT
jgi:hypothetical protein